MNILIFLAIMLSMGMLSAEVVQRLNKTALSRNNYTIVVLLWWILIPLALYNSFHPTEEE